MIFGGTGWPSSPPVGGVSVGFTIDGVEPSPPQFDVFEFGFEINPINIKIKFNIVLKI